MQRKSIPTEKKTTLRGSLLACEPDSQQKISKSCMQSRKIGQDIKEMDTYSKGGSNEFLCEVYCGAFNKA
jgi:hypothetical protein